MILNCRGRWESLVLARCCDSLVLSGGSFLGLKSFSHLRADRDSASFLKRPSAAFPSSTPTLSSPELCTLSSCHCGLPRLSVLAAQPREPLGSTGVLPPRAIAWKLSKGVSRAIIGPRLFPLRDHWPCCLIPSYLESCPLLLLFQSEGKSILCHSILVGSRRLLFTVSIRFYHFFPIGPGPSH